MATPHISCEPGDIAELVVMPGDPLRAKRIADNYLTSVKCVSQVRGIGIYTGLWSGHKISVLASGMGIPSAMIYATELYETYQVQRICRVGTAGGLSPRVKIRDVVIAQAAHTSSRVGLIQVPDVTVSLFASFDMLAGGVQAAKENSERTGQVHVGAVYSSDYFYLDRPDITSELIRIGTLAVEMEAAGLYAVAARHKKEALAVLTISDHVDSTESNMTAGERETNFEQALQIGVSGLLA